MPGKKHFRHHVKDLCDAIARRLRAFEKDQDPEALHELRVATKKIKAILFLQRKCAGMRKFAVVAPALKNIYSEAGALRTSGINLRQAGRHPLNASVRNKLKKNLEEGTRAFTSKIPACLPALEQDARQMGEHLKSIKEKCILRLFRREAGKINELLERDSLLHEARKKIKNLIYLHDLCGRSLRRKSRLDTGYLRHLEKSIGDWNDAVTAIAFLKKINAGSPGRLKTERERLLRKVRKHSRHFQKKARE